MRVCPHCRQDYVWEVTIRDLPGTFYMCLECDTVWMTPGDVSDEKGQIFETFMEQHSLKADWKAITQVKQLENELSR